MSSIATNVEVARAIAIPLYFISILFSGFYITIENTPYAARWIPYVSLVRWVSLHRVC